MKLIDYTRQPAAPSFLQKYLERLPTWLPFWFSEKIAHERLVTRLGRELDNRFLLLKNLPLGRLCGFDPVYFDRANRAGGAERQHAEGHLPRPG